MTSQGQRFRRRAVRRGYKVDEVDAFLDRVEATLAGDPTGAPVTAQDVHDVVFRVRFGGYDEWQVDLHLDRAERQLADVEEHGGGFVQVVPEPRSSLGAWDDRFASGAPRDERPTAPHDDRMSPVNPSPMYNRPLAPAGMPAGAMGNPVNSQMAAQMSGPPTGSIPPISRPAGQVPLPTRPTSGPLPMPNRPVSGHPLADGPLPGGPGFGGPTSGAPILGGPMGNGPMGNGPMGAGPMGGGRLGNSSMPGGPFGDSSMSYGPSSIQPMSAPPMSPPPMSPPPMSAPPMSPPPMSAPPMSPPPMSAPPMSPPPMSAPPMSPPPMSPPPMSAPPMSPSASASPVSPPPSMSPPAMSPAPNMAPPPSGPGPVGYPRFEDTDYTVRGFGDEFGRRGRIDMTTEIHMPRENTNGFPVPVSGADLGGDAPPELQRIDAMRRTFTTRRFGSGYDASQVNRLFDVIIDSLSGHGMPLNESELDPNQFSLVPGGYFEGEVNNALREVRSLVVRR